MKQYKEKVLTVGISNLTSNSQSFNFLNEEEDLYTEADIKDPFDG